MSKFIARARHLASRFGAEDKIEKEALKIIKKHNAQSPRIRQHTNRKSAN